jgi:hypothetical protein
VSRDSSHQLRRADATELINVLAVIGSLPAGSCLSGRADQD